MLDVLFTIPYSMLFIFLVNICMVLVGTLIFRLMIDVDHFEAQESEVRSYERSLNEAKRRNDKAALRKLRRAEVRIKMQSSAVSRQRLKAGMVTLLPFTAASIVLNTIYVGKEIILFPFEFALFSPSSSFSIWYFLTYLTAYLPLSRHFRTSPGFWPSSGTRIG